MFKNLRFLFFLGLFSTHLSLFSGDFISCETVNCLKSKLTEKQEKIPSASTKTDSIKVDLKAKNAPKNQASTPTATPNIQNQSSEKNTNEDKKLSEYIVKYEYEEALSSNSDDSEDDSENEQNNEVRDLILPPNLIRPKFKDSFKIPKRQSDKIEFLFPIHSNDQQSIPDASLRKTASVEPGWFLKNSNEVRLKRDGQVFYLDINRSVNQVWALITRFLKEKQIDVSQANVDTAYFETNWQSYKPDLPGEYTGFLNKFLNTVSEGEYANTAVPILSRFRINLMVSGENKTEIFVSHDGLVERILDGDSYWEPVKNNHFEELAFLYNLMRFLGLNTRQVVDTVQAQNVQQITWSSEEKTAILYYRTYTSAWRHLNSILINNQQLIRDHYDRSIGEIYVKSSSALGSDALYSIVLRQSSQNITLIQVKYVTDDQSNVSPGSVRGVRVILDILYNLLKEHVQQKE